VHPRAEPIDHQIFDPEDDDRDAIDLDLGAESIFARQAGRRRRLEQQVETPAV
jgi:hypothetical protein